MALDSNKTKLTERQRYLSIVYFVEAGKTRNLKIPVKMLYWGLGSLGILVFWSAFSIFLISSSSSRLAETESQLSSSLEAIFAYQTQYENVYELAYQGTNPKVEASQDQKPADLDREKQDTDAPTQPISVVEDKKVNLGKGDGELASPTKSQAMADEGSELIGDVSEKARESSIFVNNFKFKRLHEKFQVFFDIRNSDQSKQAIGSVWAVARIVNDDGTQTFVSAPQNLKTDENGVAVNLSSAHKFNLRYFKSKVFDFTPTKLAQSGKVDWVEVSVMDQAGRKKSERFFVDTSLKGDAAAPEQGVMTNSKSKNEESHVESLLQLRPETDGFHSKTQAIHPLTRHAELQTN